MNRFWIALAAAMLVPVGASAANSVAATWTRFVDPDENSFAVEVPQGWVVKGGVKRLSPLLARGWMTAVSPDGAVQIFLGDPNVPGFSVPKNGAAEGASVPSGNPNFPPTVALTYHGGADFAVFYGPRNLAAIGCTDARVTGTWPMPDLARMQDARNKEAVRGIRIRGGLPPSSSDEAGLAVFTCQSNGRPFAAGVVANTSPPTQFGMWGASVIAGYLAAPAQEQLAQAVLSHLLGSRQWNPQWDQAMRDKLQEMLDNQNQQADAFMSQMQQQWAQWGEALRVQGENNQARLTANHNAYMDEQYRRSERSRENFRAYQAQRSLNSWRFDAHIRNGELYRDTDTGRIFEVDH